jgi:transposase-like protein
MYGLGNMASGVLAVTRDAKVALLSNALPLPTTAPRPISAMQLAHGHYSKAERAFIAADLFTGRRTLADHTVAGLARYVGINPGLIHWALQRQGERELIEQGLLPLVPPPSRAVRAERQIAKLVREHGHRRVAAIRKTNLIDGL